MKIGIKFENPLSPIMLEVGDWDAVGLAKITRVIQDDHFTEQDFRDPDETFEKQMFYRKPGTAEYIFRYKITELYIDNRGGSRYDNLSAKDKKKVDKLIKLAQDYGLKVTLTDLNIKDDANTNWKTKWETPQSKFCSTPYSMGFPAQHHTDTYIFFSKPKPQPEFEIIDEATTDQTAASSDPRPVPS